MKFVTPFFVLLMAAFSLSPAMAEENKTVSYSLKKQGRVHFQEQAQEQIAAQDSYDTVSPEDIEPAAGGFDIEEEPNGKTSLSERMRLPRKN